MFTSFAFRLQNKRYAKRKKAISPAKKISLYILFRKIPILVDALYYSKSKLIYTVLFRQGKQNWSTSNKIKPCLRRILFESNILPAAHFCLTKNLACGSCKTRVFPQVVPQLTPCSSRPDSRLWQKHSREAISSLSVIGCMNPPGVHKRLTKNFCRIPSFSLSADNLGAHQKTAKLSRRKGCCSTQRRID